jgi:hypothetical protein
MRSTGTAIAAGDYDTAAHWATFLALFSHIGYCEDKQIKLTCEPTDEVPLNTGEKHFLAFLGKVEIKYLQSTPADDTDIEDMSDEDCDLLLVSTATSKWVYVHSKRFKAAKEIISGDVESWLITNEREVASRSGYYSSGAIPTT